MVTRRVTIAKFFDKELNRVGAASGYSDDVATYIEGDTVTFSDGTGEWNGTIEDAKQRLSNMKDDAGFEAFWVIFHEIN